MLDVCRLFETLAAWCHFEYDVSSYPWGDGERTLSELDFRHFWSLRGHLYGNIAVNSTLAGIVREL